MTEENMDMVTEDAGAESQEPISILDQREGVDWHLAHLIYEADMFGSEPGVTLSVGGMLVSGNLVSGRKYFELLEETYVVAAEKLQDSNQKEALVTMGRSYGEAKQVYQFDDDHSIGEHRPVFIHLNNANIYLRDGSPINKNGNLWRGKLTSVDGIMHGTLSV